MIGRHLLGYLPVQLSQAIVGFGSVAVFTRLMPAETYGLYALALAALSLTHIVTFTWLESAVARFHARAEVRGRLRDHLATTYAVYLGVAIIAGILIAAALYLGSNARYSTIARRAF